jgi:hypothetical protein
MTITASPRAERQATAVSGPGACCAEAQADGVPCAEIRNCEECGRAHPVVLPPSPPTATG